MRIIVVFVYLSLNDDEIIEDKFYDGYVILLCPILS